MWNKKLLLFIHNTHEHYKFLFQAMSENVSIYILFSVPVETGRFNSHLLTFLDIQLTQTKSELEIDEHPLT